MKTKIIASLLVLCMTAWFSSCDLDSKVYSSFSETNFPKTEEDARSMLTGLYAYFKCNSGAVNDNSNGTWVLAALHDWLWWVDWTIRDDDR